MTASRFFVAIAIVTSIFGLAACSGGNDSGFMPATQGSASATRTPQDDIYPHPY